MSESTYSFDPKMNQTVAAEMMEANSLISKELFAMDADLRKFLSLWQSEQSKVAYEQRKQRWDSAAASMPESLRHASQTLENITSRLMRTEGTMVASWRP